MVDVSVIVPTLNEAENIDALLARVERCVEGADFDAEILVVDDGSTDGTVERVRRWETRPGVRLLARNGGRGLSDAVLAGAKAAAGTVLVVMDADLGHEPEAIPELVGPVRAGTHDMVIGSRYVPGGCAPNWPIHRRAGSRLAAMFARAFTSVRDPLSGYFTVRREILLALPSDLKGFKIGLEILARKGESLRVKEVPITFHGRVAGTSKLNLAVIRDFFRQLKALAEAGHGPGRRPPGVPLSGGPASSCRNNSRDRA